MRIMSERFRSLVSYGDVWIPNITNRLVNYFMFFDNPNREGKRFKLVTYLREVFKCV